jgi:hypothetical protein
MPVTAATLPPAGDLEFDESAVVVAATRATADPRTAQPFGGHR